MTSMGMDKSGTQSIAVNTWVKVIGWTVRAGYPGTSIVDNELVMDAGAVGNVSFRGQFNSAFQTQQFRAVLNGSTVLATVNTATVGTVNGVTVGPGDTLELQAFTNTTFAQVVQPGAAVTYLVFDQTTQDHDIDAQPQTTTWNRTAETQVNRAANANEVDVDWSVSADTHLRADHDIEAATPTWQWNTTSDMLATPRVGAAQPNTPPRLAIGVRTWDGRPVGELACNASTSASWRRDRNEVTPCSIDTYSVDAGELIPWVHWVDVWEDDEVVWSGPIQEVGTELATGATRIDAKDVAVFQWYTRTPTTQRWSGLDPAPIARDLWRDMLRLHQIDAEPELLPTVAPERFNFKTTADTRMLNQVMDELVRIGLTWTVVAGRPILGNQPDDPIAHLDACDFLVGLRRVRSGKRAANDVRVQGSNWAQTERTEMAGLHLQALVSLDNLYGVENITAAARQYLREVGAIRDVLEVPAGASLHPDAPVTTADLVPGRVFAVHAGELAGLMRLKTVEVSWSGTARDVQVTFDAVTPPIELLP